MIFIVLLLHNRRVLLKGSTMSINIPLKSLNCLGINSSLQKLRRNTSGFVQIIRPDSDLLGVARDYDVVLVDASLSDSSDDGWLHAPIFAFRQGSLEIILGHTVLGFLVTQNDLVNLRSIYQSLLDDGRCFDCLVQVLGDTVLSLKLGELFSAVDTLQILGLGNILDNHQVDGKVALLTNLPVNEVVVLSVLSDVRLKRRIRDAADRFEMYQ